jgi:hypothetical protein
VPLD